MSPRKSWPVRNTDELARHVAKSLPEVTRRQVMAVLYTALHSIRDSLGTQAAAGVKNPSVKIRHVGVFSLKEYKPTRRPHLNGTIRVVPARWRVTFRPSDLWQGVMQTWPTRTSSEEATGQVAAAHPQPLCDEETRRADVPDVLSAGPEADSGRRGQDGDGSESQA